MGRKSLRGAIHLSPPPSNPTLDVSKTIVFVHFYPYFSLLIFTILLNQTYFSFTNSSNFWSLILFVGHKVTAGSVVAHSLYSLSIDITVGFS